MKFENIVAKLSQILSIVVIFFLASGFYMGQKGFVWQNGRLVLVSDNQATEDAATNAEANTPNAEATTIADKNTNIYAPLSFEVTNPHVLGDKNAPITIYEFSSFGCGYCADFHLDMLPKIKKEFIDTNKVKLVYVPFPLDDTSLKASMLASCVSDDKYFDFVELVYKNKNNWAFSRNPEEALAKYGVEEGLSKEKSLSCMNDEKISQKIKDMREYAFEQLNITGTPAFLIKGADKEMFIDGLPSITVFISKINEYL